MVEYKQVPDKLASGLVEENASKDVHEPKKKIFRWNQKMIPTQNRLSLMFLLPIYDLKQPFNEGSDEFWSLSIE